MHVWSTWSFLCSHSYSIKENMRPKFIADHFSIIVRSSKREGPGVFVRLDLFTVVANSVIRQFLSVVRPSGRVIGLSYINAHGEQRIGSLPMDELHFAGLNF